MFAERPSGSENPGKTFQNPYITSLRSRRIAPKTIEHVCRQSIESFRTVLARAPVRGCPGAGPCRLLGAAPGRRARRLERRAVPDLRPAARVLAHVRRVC